MKKNKLILGTVQFGLDYGINNKSGIPSSNIIKQILDYAMSNGIEILDTAEAYGISQQRIGQYHQLSKKKFKIITKYSPSNKNLPQAITDIISKNLKILNVKNLYSYMFHSYKNYKSFYLLFKDELIKLRKHGLIQNIGVSLHSNDHIKEVLKNSNINIIQIPFNMLDNAYQREKILSHAAAKGVEVHTRSVFLQGLFFKNLNKIDNKFVDLKNGILKIKKIVSDEEIGNLALNYAHSKKYIDKVLIGVDNLAQLKQNLKYLNNFKNKKLLKEVDKIKIKKNKMLNPSNW